MNFILLVVASRGFGGDVEIGLAEGGVGDVELHLVGMEDEELEDEEGEAAMKMMESYVGKPYHLNILLT